MNKKIIIINGPNLNLTGKREESIYGKKSFDDYFKEILLPYSIELSLKLEYYQSNHEGEIIDKIHECIGSMDFIIINPGALTHYSYSIHDALLASKIPSIEVHMSNIFSREKWRTNSVISSAATGIISGFGLKSYLLALT
ncbi:MAG: type II 3-dehydroquinate dehydratase, partial [Candidatus Humimicrobiaceae bacterium]